VTSKHEIDVTDYSITPQQITI